MPRRRKKGEVVAGVDINAGWVPTYVVVEREEGKSKGRRTAKDILAELKKEANKSNRVFLATDRDREGEAFKPEEYWKLTAPLAPAGTVSLPGYPRPLSVRKAGDETEAEPEGEDGEAKPRKQAKAELPEGTYQAELDEWTA